MKLLLVIRLIFFFRKTFYPILRCSRVWLWFIHLHSWSIHSVKTLWKKSSRRYKLVIHILFRDVCTLRKTSDRFSAIEQYRKLSLMHSNASYSFVSLSINHAFSYARQTGIVSVRYWYLNLKPMIIPLIIILSTYIADSLELIDYNNVSISNLISISFYFFTNDVFSEPIKIHTSFYEDNLYVYLNYHRILKSR